MENKEELGELKIIEEDSKHNENILDTKILEGGQEVQKVDSMQVN